MIYTEEQFQALAPFEGYFRTATRSGYAGYVGFRNAEKIDKIIREAGLYKSGARTNYACASCVLRILRVAGKAYFQDKEARIAAANDAEAAKISAAAQEPVEEPAQEPEPELESKPEQTPELSAQQALDESAAKPSLDVKADGDIVEATATYLAPEPAPAEEPEPEPAAAATQEPATAPSTPKVDPIPAKTPKPAKTAPKSKTAKK